jgi:hypothetical protein
LVVKRPARLRRLRNAQRPSCYLFCNSPGSFRDIGRNPASSRISPRPLIEHPCSLSERQPDARAMLDCPLEYRAGPAETVAGIEQVIDLRSVPYPLLDLVEITVVRVDRAISHLVCHRASARAWQEHNAIAIGPADILFIGMLLGANGANRKPVFLLQFGQGASQPLFTPMPSPQPGCSLSNWIFTLCCALSSRPAILIAPATVRCHNYSSKVERSLSS